MVAVSHLCDSFFLKENNQAMKPKFYNLKFQKD